MVDLQFGLNWMILITIHLASASWPWALTRAITGQAATIIFVYYNARVKFNDSLAAYWDRIVKGAASIDVVPPPYWHLILIWLIQEAVLGTTSYRDCTAMGPTSLFSLSKRDLLHVSDRFSFPKVSK